MAQLHILEAWTADPVMANVALFLFVFAMRASARLQEPPPRGRGQAAGSVEPGPQHRGRDSDRTFLARAAIERAVSGWWRTCAVFGSKCKGPVSHLLGGKRLLPHMSKMSVATKKETKCATPVFGLHQSSYQRPS